MSFGNTYSDGRGDIFKGSLLLLLLIVYILAGSSKRRSFLQFLYKRLSYLNPWFSLLFVRYKGDNIALDDN
jgi:hypothetical protein